MHVAEGVLATPVLIGGGILAAGAVAAGLRAIDDGNTVKVAVLASAFFVASLIHVPVGPSSVHLVLNGLMGLFLGWAIFPAVAVALLLQAVLFGFGGFTTLGVNIVVMGLPGLICFYCFRGIVARRGEVPARLAGFAAGSLAIALGATFYASALFLSGREFASLAGITILAHIPVMVIEGFVTVSAVSFLRQVRPEAFHTAPLVSDESAA